MILLLQQYWHLWFAGIIFGAIFTYAIEEEKPKRYQLLREECEDTTVETGDTLIIQGSAEESYFCTIEGKVYKDSAGNDLQESVKYLNCCTSNFDTYNLFTFSFCLILSYFSLFFFHPSFFMQVIVCTRYKFFNCLLL